MVKPQDLNSGRSHPKASSVSTWVPRQVQSGRAAQPHPCLSPPGTAVPCPVCEARRDVLIGGCDTSSSKPVRSSSSDS